MRDGPSVPAHSPPPWLPLLQHLTVLCPSWGVWKNADAALAGQGDIDSVSHPDCRVELLRAFSEWAAENHFAPVFECPHLPGSVLGVAVRDRRELIELQLCERAMFRGSVLFTAHDLTSMMVMDERGFRRLRPGSEGLLLLFHNVARRGGRRGPDTPKQRRVIELMHQDPAGVDAASAVFGTARKAALRVVHAAMNGGWDTPSALSVELWAAARAPANPRLLASRGLYRATGGRACGLLPLLRTGRRIRGDYDAWLSGVMKRHPMERR